MSLTLERDGIEVATPELDKLRAIPEERKTTIQEFIDWFYDREYVVAQWAEETRYDQDGNPYQFQPNYPLDLAKSREELMEEFFGIDARKISEEKGLILEAIREGYENGKRQQ